MSSLSSCQPIGKFFVPIVLSVSLLWSCGQPQSESSHEILLQGDYANISIASEFDVNSMSEFEQLALYQMLGALEFYVNEYGEFPFVETFGVENKAVVRLHKFRMLNNSSIEEQIDGNVSVDVGPASTNIVGNYTTSQSSVVMDMSLIVNGRITRFSNFVYEVFNQSEITIDGSLNLEVAAAFPKFIQKIMARNFDLGVKVGGKYKWNVSNQFPESLIPVTNGTITDFQMDMVKEVWQTVCRRLYLGTGDTRQCELGTSLQLGDPLAVLGQKIENGEFEDPMQIEFVEKARTQGIYPIVGCENAESGTFFPEYKLYAIAKRGDRFADSLQINSRGGRGWTPRWGHFASYLEKAENEKCLLTDDHAQYECLTYKFRPGITYSLTMSMMECPRINRGGFNSDVGLSSHN